jgi:hypothetical protein
MADFDPDEYLKSKPTVAPAPAFDPDAYLAQQDQANKYAKFQQLSIPHQALIGVGHGLHNLGMGVQQVLGLKSKEDIDALRAKEAYMGKSTAQNIGNVVGSALPFAATAAIPGANTVTGAALTSAAMGALEPVGTGESRLANAGISGVLGGGITKLGNIAGEAYQSSKAAQDFIKSQNATRDETLRLAQEAGYKVPPAIANPSTLNKALESVAGKVNIAQSLSAHNQEITNKLAKQSLGLPEHASLSKETINDLLYTKSAPYREASALPIGPVAPGNPKEFNNLMLPSEIMKNGKQLVEDIKLNQDISRANWKAFHSGNNPTESMQAAHIADAKVNELQNQLEKLAQYHNQPNILNNLKNAKVELAKIHTVDNALNDATGNVNALQLAKAFNKDVPLTNELNTIGRFAEGFGKYTQKPEMTGTPGVSKAKAYASAILAGLGGAGGGPWGAAIGATAPLLADEAAKSIYLSRSMLPNYEVGTTKSVVNNLLNNPYAAPLVAGTFNQKLANILQNKEQQ